MKKKTVLEHPALINNHGLSEAQIAFFFQKMIIIRKSEERIALRVRQKKIATPCHLYIGQEAIAVGVCSALRDSDYVFSTHRSHGHYLAKGGDIYGLFGEVYCKENGCSGGRGGSMHLCDPSIGLLGSSSIVGGCLGIGIGPALKSRILGTDDVSVIFHGDCVPEEGIWHESLNFSAIKKLPVIYVCENNLYAASAPLEERRVYDNIAHMAKENGLETMVVDGNDIFAVYDAACKAVARAREGNGPQFIECRTYRWLGHVGYRDDIDVGLRSQDELDWWKQRCPIKVLRKYIVDNNLTCDLQKIENDVNTLIDDAEITAIVASKPNVNTLLKNIYKESEVTAQ
jgi:TPP-dependent pyruvate/acetoin dehydrogenase alpha subunit